MRSARDSSSFGAAIERVFQIRDEILRFLAPGAQPDKPFLDCITAPTRAALRGRVQASEAGSVVDERAIREKTLGVLAIVQERLSPGVVGRVEVHGATWTARNTSNVTLDPGQRARVAAVDGLTLAVVPE